VGSVSNRQYPDCPVRTLFLASLLLGCESKARPAAPAEPDRDTTAAVARVRAIPTLGARLRPDSQLIPATLGVTLDTPLKGLDTILPLTARASMRIKRDDQRTIDFSAEHASDTRGLIDSGAMVFVQPTTGVDVFLISEPSRVTELRVLRTSTAPTTATWTVRRADGVAPLRIVGNTIEAAKWLRTDPIELVDSAGTKRNVALTIDGERIVATYDLTNLRFPAAFAIAWNELP
jgi:hypothetical protein